MQPVFLLLIIYLSFILEIYYKYILNNILLAIDNNMSIIDGNIRLIKKYTDTLEVDQVYNIIL